MALAQVVGGERGRDGAGAQARQRGFRDKDEYLPKHNLPATFCAQGPLLLLSPTVLPHSGATSTVSIQPLKHRSAQAGQELDKQPTGDTCFPRTPFAHGELRMKFFQTLNPR